MNEIDSLLSNNLIGAEIDKELSLEFKGLNEDHPFYWNTINNNPKGDHGEYQTRGTWYKTMKYEVLHSGGFLRLYTLRGRIYWNAQNETEHTTPDWKFHVSCHLDDIPLAWNSLTALFMDMKCEIGMKVTTLSNNEWSESQRGREVTIYIFRFHHTYRNYMQGVVPEHDHDLYLGTEYDQIYNSPFWYRLIKEIEKRCLFLGIRSRGVADGDLALPGCHYVSLRNEAYISIPTSIPIPIINTNTSTTTSPTLFSSNLNEDSKSENNIESNLINEITQTQRYSLVYPPNSYGWNAANHPNPMLDVIFFLREYEKIFEQFKNWN